MVLAVPPMIKSGPKSVRASSAGMSLRPRCTPSAPTRFTTTKQRLAPVLGLEGYRAIVEAMRRENILLPVVAIGGITRADLLPVLQTGVSGVAISGGILDAEQPVEETKAILSILEQSEQQ